MKKTTTTRRTSALSALQASAGQVATLLRAIGNQRRLMLLCLLIEHSEMTAGELAENVDLSPSATSQHLAKMREEGLVAFRRDAQTIVYRISDPRITELIVLLRNLYCR